VAATYKRGMDFGIVSTTLLGAVDAAVGGKAGVNFGPVKNAVGAFTTPQMVLLDLAALKTLQTPHRREGLVEAYKTGLAADPDLTDLIETQRGSLLRGDVLGLAEVASRSARAKAGVVAEDFTESGRRAILNLGHTYGHALESWHGYRIGHGRAVAAGLRVAVEISRNRGLLDDETALKIDRTIRRLAPPVRSAPRPQQAWELMKHDKKNRGGRVTFVLLKGSGRPVLVTDVTVDELAAALRNLGGES
jgi:3-dehydroquinate synthetase